MTSQYLTFRIAGEEYAMGLLRIREIFQYQTGTVVPGVPSHIRGVINLRGRVVPVVDLALKFGLPESPITKRTCVIIVELTLDGEATVMGVLADSVKQVIDLAESDIQPPPSFGTRVRVDFLQGMGQLGKGFALLLDIDRLLSLGELKSAVELGEEAVAAADGPPPEALPMAPVEPEVTAP